MKMICDDFRSNVRELLAKRGWTQRELAEQMGVTQGYVSQLLTGHHEPGLSVVERVAKALGVTPMRLIRKKNSAQPA